MVVGTLLVTRLRVDEGIAAFHKAIAIAPNDSRPYQGLAFMLMNLHRSEEAIEVWRDLLKRIPNDRNAHGKLGSMLMVAKKYSEAIPHLEAVIDADVLPGSPVRVQLGVAYLGAGETAKAADMFKKAVETGTVPACLNEIAYTLAEHNLNLQDAQVYAEKAVQAEEIASSESTLEAQGDGADRHKWSLASYWDTLGWVHFRQGNLEKAEKYVRASWMLGQTAVVADHLGQIYEKQGKKPSAIQMYAAALAADNGVHQSENTETRRRLVALAGTKARADSAIVEAREHISQGRTVKVIGVGKHYGSANLLILFSAGPKVEQVKFVSGAEELRVAEKAITAAKFDLPFPDDGPTRVVRSATLFCSQISGCMLALDPVSNSR